MIIQIMQYRTQISLTKRFYEGPGHALVCLVLKLYETNRDSEGSCISTHKLVRIRRIECWPL